MEGCWAGVRSISGRVPIAVSAETEQYETETAVVSQRMRRALTGKRKEGKTSMRNRKQSGEGEARDGESESGLTNDDDGNLDGLGEDEMMRAKPERKDAFVRPLAMRRRFAEEDLLDMSWRTGYIVI